MPNINDDIAALTKGFREVHMNAVGLSKLARSRMQEALDKKDLVAYGSEVQYWWDRIETNTPKEDLSDED